MRVVFGHQRFGVQPFGGISRYFVELALGLSRIPGVHPSIFSPFHVNHYLRASPSVHSRGVHLPPFPGSGLPLGIANQVLSELFVRPRRDIDIYHETYYSAFDTKPRGAARVLTVFDMIHELYPHEFGKMDRTSRSKASRRAGRPRHLHI